ncbi:DUF6290 family protein [Cryobacterium sp. PH31-AA6]|uniref:type II toxin-antitoxin system RelB family antitoxin n=1 Tax=Cryobacterium sp. PH31-AA6 TaxID=3046205 RepID=UPI0024B8E594|nr:DUF6290 family protein [Cryobacterium sp. PH31-AA6]MDJ0322370.1 DUF6290 family protein [Cryobacterium sp. PH31-AA6]
MAISVRLTPEDEQRLEQLAARTGRSKSFYVREAIHEHLDDLEERCWADRVIRGWEESGKESRPADELWAELGLRVAGDWKPRRSSIARPENSTDQR